MRPIYFFLAASAALNVAAMVSVDRAFLYEGQKTLILQQQKRMQEERDKLPFEFVESPQVKSERPSSARKMSNRDSLARDRQKNKTADNPAPIIQKEGPADQLAQSRAKSAPTQRPSPAIRPQKEMKKSDSLSRQEQARPQPQPKPQPKPKAPEKPAAEEKMSPRERQEEVRVPTPPPAPPKSLNPPSPADQQKRPGQEAQTGRRQFSGIDRITTQEMIRAKTRGASLSGATSFDAMGSDMGIYMKNLKEKIWLAWYPYLAFQYPSDFQTADAVISMTLDAKGDVKMVKVLGSDGSPLFSTFCTEAVQRASGFGPVPKEIRALLGKDEIEIKFAFHYR